ncbi:ribonuclease H-like domain-containing protein [Tanacetum coccineum]
MSLPYLKHEGRIHILSSLKGKSFDEIQKLFDKEMKRVNTFVAMGSEVQESKEKKVEGSEQTAKGSRKKMLGRKRARKEQQQESSKKQRMEEDKESDEVSEDDEGELMKHLVIKKDEDIAIDAIPLATKLPVIIDYKLHKEGMLVHYQLIRADGSSKRYSSMIRMLQGIDREDLEALWKIVKTKYSDIRPEDEFERVLWGDLKVMFEPDIRSDVWRMLQGYRVTVWKLIDSSGVHFVRFDNLHIFMLVEKRYPLTPITITNMLNKKLQTDHQNEMCYQLLKLMKMNIKFRGGLLGLKRLHGFLEVTTAQVHNGNYAKWFGINKWYQSFSLRNFDLEYMELESTNSGPTTKLPILKLGEYEIQYPDAKSMFAAIETRFGGNAAIKKTQKTLLKQQYENFSASKDFNLKFLYSLPPEWNTHVVIWMNKPEVETISIDDLYNNFKIVEQKVKKTVGTSSGGQNLAFMTAPSTSSTNDANTASPEVSAASPSVNAASPQVCTASVSDNTVYAFMVENPNGSNVLHQDLEQIHEDDLEAMDLKWQLSLLSVECYNCHKLGHFARECRAPRSKEGQFRNQDNTRKQGNNEDTSSKAMLAIDGVGFDWSDMAEEQVQTNMALMAFSDSEASKDLDQLLGSQITDKSKKGLGYSVVPPPHLLVYNRPNKLDLSYSGLDEFKEPEFKGYGLENSKQESNVVCNKESDNSKENSNESLVEDMYHKDKEQVNVGRGKPQHDGKGFVDSGCSRHKTGNIGYLSDFKKFDGVMWHLRGAERRNRTLIEAARTMLADSKLPTTFWAETVSTTCYVQNRVLLLQVQFLMTSAGYIRRKQSRLHCDANLERYSLFDYTYHRRFADDSSTKDVNVVGQHINTASPDVNTGSLKLNVVGPSVNTASPNEQDNTEEKPEI